LSVDDATLIISVKDDSTPVLNRIVTALERYNTATSQTNKETVALERSLGSMAAKAAAGGAGVDRATAALTRAAIAAKAYQATIANIGTVRLNSAGQTISSRTGQFLGTAEVTAYQKAVAGLNAIETNRVRQLTIGNAEQAAMNGSMRGAVPIGYQYSTMLNAQAASIARVNAQMTTQRAVQAGLSVRGSNIGPAIQTGSFLNANKEIQTVTSGAARAQSALSGLSGISNSTRYALYSVSRALASLGVGLLAIPVASAILAANYEKDFANVQRTSKTTGVQAQALKASLIDLSTSIPVSFKGITEIATLGGQLGIAASGLVSFTRTVAMLTATTNLSSEAAGTFIGKFSKIGGVKPEDFNRLASSVLNVGVNTAATETQITKLSTQLVGVAKAAGFTVPQLIGISGAMASVTSTGPELARGAIYQFISKIQLAAQSGGPVLEAFAKTAGVSMSTVQDAFGTEKFAPLFTKFFTGLDKVAQSGGNASGVLNQLGITSVRYIPLLLSLARGHVVLKDAIDLANKGWSDGTLLQVQFGILNDTLINKLIELGNGFGKFLNQIGGAANGPFKDVVNNLTAMVKGLSDFASTDGGQQTLVWIAALVVLAGVLALTGAALANIVAGAQAAGTAYAALTLAVGRFDAAQARSAATSLTGMSRLERFATFMTGPWGLAIIAATVGITILVDSLEKLKATSAEVQDVLAKGRDFNVIATVSSQGGPGGNLFQRAAGADVEAAFKNFKVSIQQQTKLLGGNLWDQIVAGFGQGSLKTAQTQQIFADRLKDLGTGLAAVAKVDMPAAQHGFGELAWATDHTRASLLTLLKGTGDYRAELVRQLEVSHVAVTDTNLLNLAIGGSGDSAAKATGQYKQLTEEMKRQRDFKNDLNAIISNQSDANAKDPQKVINAVSDAYQKSIQPLTDFNAIVQQVQTSLQAAADQQSKLSGVDSKKIYDGASVSLSQFTAQLVDNNTKQAEWFSNVMQVSSKYGSQAASVFINAGYSAVNNSIMAQLLKNVDGQGDAYIAAQTTKMEQAVAASGEVLIAAGNLTMVKDGSLIGDETAKAMAKALLIGVDMPTIMKTYGVQLSANPITPVTNPGPAQASMDNLIWNMSHVTPPNINPGFTGDSARAKMQNLIWDMDHAPAPITTPEAKTEHARGQIMQLVNQPYPNVSISVIANMSAFQIGIRNAQLQANAFAAGKVYTGGATGGYFNGTSFRGYGGGGFTGPGTKYQVAGVVHAGEFVFPQESVRRLGLSTLFALMHNTAGARSAPRMGYAEGGMVGGGNFSAIDAQSLQAIMALANRPIYLYTTDRVIAETAARGNTEIAYGGQN
jgi:TP901 family phage tail tape measure protein